MAGEITRELAGSELDDPEDSSVGGSQEPVSQSDPIAAAEESVAERIQSALNAPKAMHDSMTPSSVSYSLLQEDLKFRSQHNKVLMQEQSMVGNMRAQHELVKLSKKNDEEALLGIEALQMAQDLHLGGMEDADIRIKVTDHFNLYAFPGATKSMDNFLKVSETPLEEAQREMKKKTDENNMLSLSYNAEVTAAKAGWKRDNIEKDRAQAILLAEDAEDEAAIKRIERNFKKAHQAAQHKNNEYTIAKLQAGPEGRVLASMPSMGKVQDLFDDIGIGGNAQLLWSALPNEDSLRFLVGGGADGPKGSTAEEKGLFGLLAEKISASGKTTIDGDDIWTAVQDLGNPELRKLADAGDEEAIARLSTATGYLRRGGRLYQSTYADAINYRTEQEIRARAQGKLETRHTTRYDNARKEFLEYDPPKIDGMKSQKAQLKLLIEALQGDLSVKSGRPLSSSLDWDDKKALLATHGISYTDNAALRAGTTTGEHEAWGWEPSEQMEKLLWKGHEAGIWLYDGTPRTGDVQESEDQHKSRGMSHLLKLMEVHPAPTTPPEGYGSIDLDKIPQNPNK